MNRFSGVVPFLPWKAVKTHCVVITVRTLAVLIVVKGSHREVIQPNEAENMKS